MSESGMFGRHGCRTAALKSWIGRYARKVVKVQTEEKLIAAFRGGERDAYAVLTKRYAQQVFAVCLGFTGRVHDAEDIAQDAFVKGFTQLNQLRDTEQFGAWICRIARNLCIDDFRKRRVRRDALTSERLKPVSDETKPKSDYSELEKAISRLPENYRVALLMYYFDGQDARSVGKSLNISSAAVATRLSRARKQLRQLLDEQEVRNG